RNGVGDYTGADCQCAAAADKNSGSARGSGRNKQKLARGNNGGARIVIGSRELDSAPRRTDHHAAGTSAAIGVLIGDWVGDDSGAAGRGSESDALVALQENPGTVLTTAAATRSATAARHTAAGKAATFDGQRAALLDENIAAGAKAASATAEAAAV